MKNEITYIKKLTFLFIFLPFVTLAQWTPVNSNVTEGLSDVFFFDSSIGYCAGNNGTLLKSIDGGDTWFSLDVPITDHIVKVQFITPDIGFFESYNFNGGFSIKAIYGSTDGGNSWTSVMESFPAPQIDNQDLHSRNANFYFNGKHGVVNLLYSDNPQTASPTKESWKTSDYGENWVKLEDNITGTDPQAHVIILDSLTWFAGATNLMKTIDGGITWEESLGINFGGFAINKYDSWHIHDATGKGIGVASYHLDITQFESFNVAAQNAFDSTNWQGSYHVNKMKYVDSLGYFLFGPDNTGTAYIKRTINDGSYFLPQIDTLMDIHDIEFQDINNGWACGKNGAIYKTTTGGGIVSLTPLETENTDFVLYPNPSAEVINIKLLNNQEVITISLHNANGQLIKRYDNSERSLDIKDISTGLYYLNIETKEGSVSKKVVVK